LELASGYKFLPHTTDAYIQAVGSTIEEAFSYAAIALVDTMCNAGTVEGTMNETLQVEAPDEVALLQSWLELLLLKFELEHRVFTRFDKLRIARQNGALRLAANCSGEMYDRQKHGAKVEVKAVTLHRMEVLRRDRFIVVRFILDL